jgi:hypothetical protein
VSRWALIAVGLAACAVAIAAWLVSRAALRGMRRYIRNLWPH